MVMAGQTLLFGVIAGVASVLVLSLVLRPLWRPRGARVAAIGLVAGLVVVALSLYALVGTPAALDPAAREAPRSIEAAIVQLEAQLQREPKSPEGWRLLGRAYASAQQPAKSADAYARAAAVAPEQPDVLVEAAESRALAAANRRFDARGVAWLQRALDLQPQHQRARWFLGIAQRQAGDAAAAARTWEPLLSKVQGSTAVPLREQIDLARKDAGLPPLPVADTTPAPGHAVTVRVELDPAIASRVRLDGNATVFVVARAVGGPPMPVAAERHAASGLPFTTMLDDRDSPMPTQRLSALREVEISARLSRSGDATPAEGDLQSDVVRVPLPAQSAITLRIGAGE